MADPVPVIDTYGRVADDLRISVTDRCNFRCIYCMPAQGLEWLSRDQVLSFDEIQLLATIFVRRYGVRTIRLTGGEPLVRSKIEDLVAMIDEIDHGLAETPLRDLLRGGATGDEVCRVIEAAVWGKEEGHLINQAGFVKPAESMSQIGG